MAGKGRKAESSQICIVRCILAFAGEMTITTPLTPETDSTLVTIACRNVLPGIGEDDHLSGIASTLENLAAYVE